MDGDGGSVGMSFPFPEYDVWDVLSGNYNWDNIGSDIGGWVSGLGDSANSFLGGVTGNIIGTDQSNAANYFGTSLSQTGGKLAGAAGLFSPIGTLAEAGFGLTDRANLNDQLSQLGIDGLSWGDTLGAAINPFMDQRDYAMDKIYNTMNFGAGVNSDNYGGAESVASSFMGANPLSQGGNIDLSQLDVGAMMAPTFAASGIPVPEFNYVPGSALTQPVQDWAWNPTPSMQPSSYGWGFHPGNR